MASAKLQKVYPRLFSVNAVCEMLGICRTTLYDLMKKGDVAYVKVGDRRRIPAAEVDRIVGEVRKASLL